jgi:hypothetical protein
MVLLWMAIASVLSPLTALEWNGNWSSMLSAFLDRAASGILHRSNVENTMLRRGRSVHVLGLTLLMVGCNNAGRTSISPSTPSIVAISTGSPTTPPRPVGSSVLSGVIVEVTATGRVAVEGAAVHLMTCGAPNCPGAVGHNVTTDKDGAYRIPGVYDGDLNYLWVRNEVYELVNPMPVGTCPDGCDRVVTVSGDTTLNIDLVRTVRP